MNRIVGATGVIDIKFHRRWVKYVLIKMHHRPTFCQRSDRSNDLGISRSPPTRNTSQCMTMLSAALIRARTFALSGRGQNLMKVVTVNSTHNHSDAFLR